MAMDQQRIYDYCCGIVTKLENGTLAGSGIRKMAVLDRSWSSKWIFSLLLSSAGGCGIGSTAPDAQKVTGLYVLTEVNGQALPVGIETGISCPTQIVDGQ